MKTWRLLDTPPMTAAANMALDETLVELKGQGATPNTIHFLQFAPRSVLVGFHQSVAEEIRSDYCRRQGIDINRRVTGGGAIFFDESQLGWEVICDKAFFNVSIPDQRLFKKLCDPVITALALLGVTATFRPRNDIEINGRKISGTGGTESGDAFLFQGTMLVDFDVDTMLKCLRIPVEKLKAKEIDSVRERVTCLKWELGRVPDLESIKSAVRAGFEQHLGIRLVPGGLTAQEQALFERKLPAFESKKWIEAVNPRFQRREVLQAAYKGEAGLVRFTVVVNPISKRIKDIFITGDFLSFPARALYDLETRLRGLPLEKAGLHAVVRRFFDEGHIRIPGMGADDFLKPLDQVLAKLEIAAFGIALVHCNQISVTNGAFADIVRQKPSVLLLPYCSKLIECELRYAKGCRACGECTVGDAWTLGRQQRLRTVCITSFEDLQQELARMKATGHKAFIGCCCQPFFTKHVDDFERAGLPGILLDIDCTTCYELDQAREAYAGVFDKQTAVNLELLETVLKVCGHAAVPALACNPLEAAG
jgi:lipoate---protein ligase